MKCFAAAVAGAVLLSSCTNLTSQQRQDLSEAVINEMVNRIEMLQEAGLRPFEVPTAVLVGADAACAALSIGSPFMVQALNRKVQALNEQRGPAAQIDPLTVSEFQTILSGACKVVQRMLVPKAEGAPSS